MKIDSKLFKFSYFWYTKTYFGKVYANHLLRKARRKHPDGHSEAQEMDYMGIFIKIVPQADDNYGYIVWREGSDECALVDVYDPRVFIKMVREMKKIPSVILTTHYHWDHCAGNKKIRQKFPGVAIYSGSAERAHCSNMFVGHADEIAAAGLKFSVSLVPGHTEGHVVYRLHVPNMSDCFFTGDFLFVAGIGRLFEGTDATLLGSLNVTKSWPTDSLIFPGHEYAKQNLEFALSLEPDNDTLDDMYRRVCDMRQSRLPALPTPLEDEFQYNPFLRVGEPGIVSGLERKGCAMPMRKTHKGRTRLDSDVVEFNYKVEILRLLRLAKEDFDEESTKEAAEPAGSEVPASVSGPAEDA